MNPTAATPAAEFLEAAGLDCLIQGKGNSCQVRLAFPDSTLPTQFRGVFLVSMQHRLLSELGETSPFDTKLLLHTLSGDREIEGNSFNWDMNASVVSLTAMGPHAGEVSSRLAALVDQVLRNTLFDQDGFVVTA